MASFVDRVVLHVSAGAGGNGCASVHREKFKPLGGPDGGNGGDGGDVVLEVDPSVHTLLDFHHHPHQKAGNGRPGEGSNRHGARGEEKVLGVPAGTVVSTPDGRVIADNHRKTLMVGIGNGRGIGGGTPLLPRALPDDGLLDVMVSQASGPFARVRFGAALSSGQHLTDKAVRHARGTFVTVMGEQVGVNADGEVGDDIRRRTWTVQPGAWSLIRP